jgi:biopolymer transport protein ExbD/biopolymer transport protein TolR
MATKIGAGAAYGGSAIPTVAGMDGQEVNSDINVTPMIDVMLVLLIIFMVITPAMAGYTAILPKANTSKSEKEDRVTLGIDNKGNYYIEKNGPKGAIAADQLETALKNAYASKPEDHILYMKADQGVQYSVILSAIDAARKAGVVRIGAITETPKDKSKKLSEVR